MPKYKIGDIIIFIRNFNTFSEGDITTIAGYKDHLDSEKGHLDSEYHSPCYIIKTKAFTWYPDAKTIDDTTVLATKTTKVLYGKF